MSTSILTSMLLLAASACVVGQTPEVRSLSSTRIMAAEKRVQSDSKSATFYNELAAAICRKARDTEDISLYDRASEALDRALKLSPGNYDARKLKVVVLLGRHQFRKALELAKELIHTTPDDLGVWALLVDVNIALGDYAEAERDAQWVLDLRPGNTLGFVKAASLREWFGDPEGASEFYHEALRRTSINDLDERAWLCTQNARMQLLLGNLKNAAASLDEARKLDSQSLFAAATLANLRTREGQYAEAASLLETRYRAVSSLTNLYDYAEALHRASKAEQAAVLFQEFETKADAARNNPYNANGRLIFYYADRKRAPEKALDIARLEMAIRPDCPAMDAYAWALYRASQFPEAKAQIGRALAVGVRDAATFCHASRITAAAGDEKEAKRLETASHGLDPSACPADAPPPEGARAISK